MDGIEARDADVMADLAPGGDTAARDLLAGIGRNAAALALVGVTARYVDQVGAVDEDGTWSGVVELTWQLDGFDPAPSEADVVVTFAPDGDTLGIVGFGSADGGGRSRTPLWLRGELSVARTAGVLVMADGTTGEADDVAQRVTRGIQVVRRVLPDWEGPVVVEVPASGADLDETLGASPGTYADIAAVTAAVGSGTADDAPVHVLVNPDVTDGLRRAGAQVVMSHELVHVATDAARSAMEPWLLEGFADYVALRNTRLPDRVTLGRAVDAVRRDGLPEALPSAADFDTRSDGLQAAYEGAWLACRIIAERVGEERLVQLYGDVSGGAAIGDRLRMRGLPLGRLTATWRGTLADLSR
ncbi:hypothetical protein GCM10009797_12800 [Nocardioides hwasunensis]